MTYSKKIKIKNKTDFMERLSFGSNIKINIGMKIFLKFFF
jgi:hypothetical protein